MQELALRVGVGSALEGRTETAGTAHGLAESGDHAGAMFDCARIECLGLAGGSGQVPPPLSIDLGPEVISSLR